MTNPSESLRNFCKIVGVKEKTVFVLAYPYVHRANNAYQRYRRTGIVPQRIIRLMQMHPCFERKGDDEKHL